MSKMKTTPVDAGASRLRTMRERAREARHAAYVLAKERRKNDPRTLELKERLKQTRREANAQAKERASKDEKLRAGIASANALGQPRSSDDP